jgi:ABC-2 type transport system permease protein
VSGIASDLTTAWALARRNLVNVVRIPGAVVPIVAMPVFFLLAFSGSFNGVTEIPSFPTDHILNWVAPYAALQGAAFAGLGSAFAAARDIEGGFYDRFLLSPLPRRALFLGPLVAAATRALIPVTIVLAIGFIGGARLSDGWPGIVTLLLAAEGLAMLSALWGLGVVFRLKTQRAMALVQVGIFVSMFLSIGQVPLDVMSGWLHAVARVNPMTNILRLAREGFLGEISWREVGIGVVALVGSGAVLATWAVRGFRRLVP